MSRLNLAPMVEDVGHLLDSVQSIARPVPRRRVTSQLCLIERLPSSGFLQREAEHDAPKAILRQLRRSPSPTTPGSDEEHPHLRERRLSTSSVGSSSSTKSHSKIPAKKGSHTSTSWKEPQPFEVFRAIEQKDIVFLMEIRDRAFPLLLRKTGDATPLLHAMRIGQSHRDVAIILLGAFSRYINNLEDAEIIHPRTKLILKALRTNLKLAIDYGLTKSQSDLTASFLQTLIMSEGDKWVGAQASNVSLALRAGTAGEPVHNADLAVRKFATKELGKAESIATLEDYVANATADLLMLGAWSIAIDSFPAEHIPVRKFYQFLLKLTACIVCKSYYFARDDRVYKVFCDLLDKHKLSIQQKLSKRTKWQLRVLRQVLEGRTTTYRSKVALLATELDEGPGV